MITIEKYDTDIMIEQMDSSIIQFYENYLFPIKQLSFKEYFHSLNIPVEDLHKDVAGYRRFYKKAKVSTKINWNKYAIRDLKEHKMGSAAEQLFNALCICSEERGIPTWESFRDDYLERITTWKADNGLLIDFPLMRFSTNKTKEIAIEKDIYLNIINMLEEDIGVVSLNGETHKGVLMQPLEFLLGPFVSVNSTGVQMSNKEENPDNTNYPILFDDYHVPGKEEVVIRSFIDTAKTLNTETNLRTLSTFDISVFLYIVNYIYEKDYATFLSTRAFQDKLSNIVRAVYPNEAKPGARCYEQVRRSLAKLSQLNVRGIRNKEVVQTINFFDYYELSDDKDDEKLNDMGRSQKLVTLTIGRYMYDRISNKKTQHVYSHEVQLLEDRSAQFVYYVFEGERQRVYASNRIEDELPYSYTFFLHTMRFPSRKQMQSNLDLIESIFKTFIDKNILIQYYRRQSNGFIIQFKPFSKEDAEKLKLSQPSLLPSYLT